MAPSNVVSTFENDSSLMLELTAISIVIMLFSVYTNHDKTN